MSDQGTIALSIAAILISLGVIAREASARLLDRWATRHHSKDTP